mmetsp:Transcript_59460/g.138496  ORF Transcript_59460/g.138496 Transcript_59460/m.138496 type:complete len:272 (+) Transcript_59460:303-1118(+)
MLLPNVRLLCPLWRVTTSSRFRLLKTRHTMKEQESSPSSAESSSPTQQFALIRTLGSPQGRNLTVQALARSTMSSLSPDRCRFITCWYQSWSCCPASTSVKRLLPGIKVPITYWKLSEHSMTRRSGRAALTLMVKSPRAASSSGKNDRSTATATSPANCPGCPKVSSPNSRMPTRWHVRPPGPSNWKLKSSTLRLSRAPSRSVRCMTWAMVSWFGGWPMRCDSSCWSSKSGTSSWSGLPTNEQPGLLPKKAASSCPEPLIRSEESSSSTTS